MAKDLFGRELLALGGAMSSESTLLTFTSLDGLSGGSTASTENIGLLIQSVRIAYDQPIARIFGLESNRAYFIVGRPQGDFSAQRIVGPSGLLGAFYSAYGNICTLSTTSKDISLSIARTNCAGDTSNGTTNATKAATVNLSNVMISGLEISGSVANFQFTDNFKAMFLGLTINEK